MQSLIFVGGALALIMVVILLIVLAPSTRNRGYQDRTEKDELESKRVLEEEQVRARGKNRFNYWDSIQYRDTCDAPKPYLCPECRATCDYLCLI